MEQQRAELDQKLLLICEDIEQCLKQAEALPGYNDSSSYYCNRTPSAGGSKPAMPFSAGTFFALFREMGLHTRLQIRPGADRTRDALGY